MILPVAGNAVRALVVLLVLTVLPACGPRARPSDAELYLIALDAARLELGLTAPLALHPFLALWNPARTPPDAPLVSFNAYDSASVPAIVKARPGSYRLCQPTVGGACRTGPGDVALVLSELFDLGPNEVALRYMVADARPGRPYQQNYLARLKAGLTGWTVVELRRADQ